LRLARLGAVVASAFGLTVGGVAQFAPSQGAGAAQDGTVTLLGSEASGRRAAAPSRCSDEPDGVWTPISQDGAPSPRWGHSAVWTGNEMLVWGGLGPTGRLGDGSRYNPETDVWRPMSTVGAPSVRGEQVAVWTGSEMVI